MSDTVMPEIRQLSQKAVFLNANFCLSNIIRIDQFVKILARFLVFSNFNHMLLQIHVKKSLKKPFITAKLGLYFKIIRFVSFIHEKRDYSHQCQLYH